MVKVKDIGKSAVDMTTVRSAATAILTPNQPALWNAFYEHAPYGTKNHGVRYVVKAYFGRRTFETFFYLSCLEWKITV